MTAQDEDTAAAPARRWTRIRTRRNGRPRRLPWVLLAVCLLIGAAAGAGIPVYAQPQIDQLRRADAVFVLGGEGFARYPYGLSLGAAGWAPTVVLSNPYGTDNDWLTRTCQTRQTGFELECFVPDPPTTKGEARQLRRLAAERGWQTVIVVTFRPHISRARYIVEQCFDGDLVMTASPAQLPWYRWVYAFGYQTVGYARAALQPGC
ncbi:YdcF family protein [Nocardia sp. NPDC051030]|uniref:YdcF family protein n=1 Tax=Nocardia sp. NPDC051030 TaxID=3155162 RepID=UPI00343733DD